jgi:hypothetical protein
MIATGRNSPGKEGGGLLSSQSKYLRAYMDLTGRNRAHVADRAMSDSPDQLASSERLGIVRSAWDRALASHRLFSHTNSMAVAWRLLRVCPYQHTYPRHMQPLKASPVASPCAQRQKNYPTCRNPNSPLRVRDLIRRT